MNIKILPVQCVKNDNRNKKIPLFIPNNPTRKEEIKSSGYQQIKYKWTKIIGHKKHTFEARLQTATPHVPAGTPANWRITIFVHGTATGEKKRKYEFVKVDTQANRWGSAKEWHEAAKAYVQQIATEAQKNLLARGHFKEDD